MHHKIAFISTMTGVPWGGSEALWSESAKRLIRQGHKVYVNVAEWPEWPKPLMELKEAGCVICRRPRVQGQRNSMVRRVLSKVVHWLRFNKADCYEVLWLKKTRPDIVIVSQASIDGANWLEACQNLGIAHTPICHLSSDMFWVSDERASYLRKIYQSVTASFFVSQSTLETLQMLLAVKLPRPSVIRNPYNVRYNSAPAWASTEPHWKLACVARMEFFHKGQDVLLKVLAQEKWRRRSLEINFFGTGPQDGQFELLKKYWGLTNVHQRGHVNDIESIWAEHHAFILPSRLEGLPISLIEAMLCGRIGIVSDVGGNAEVIKHNSTGFVARGANVTCFDETMELAWQRRSDWRTMGCKAAIEIRRIVPSDPALDFTEKVLNIISSSGTKVGCFY